MKKRIFALMVFLSVFLMPMFAYADPAKGENPVEKIESKMKWNWNALDGLDFLFNPVMLVLSLAILVAFIWVIWRLIMKIVSISRGKSSIKDKSFWVEIVAVILILFLLFSGALFKFLGNIYNWTDKQDIGGKGTAQIERKVDTFWT